MSPSRLHLVLASIGTVALALTLPVAVAQPPRSDTPRSETRSGDAERTAPQSSPSDAARHAEIAEWVDDLGHEHYLRRESASRRLVRVGPAALYELVRVVRSGELEVVERAIEVMTEIALARHPGEDGGAWDRLNELSINGVGRRASRAKSAVDEIRIHRADQAREALTAAGVFVGIDEFAIRAISKPMMIVQIDDSWRGDVETLQWLRWLRGVENARIKGAAVTREVLDGVAQIPGLKSLAIVDGKLKDDTLEPLTQLSRIHALEFRYVPLTDSQGELIASLPIRVSLNLMGTGISAAKVGSMRAQLPGLQIDYRQGGFLGVSCMDGFDACEINTVIAGSAAEQAGLVPGDVIVRVGDTKVTRFKDLQDAINQHLPGDVIEVKYERSGKVETVELKLRRFEES